MPYKKYSDDERAARVAFLFASGYPNKPGSLRYVQRITGVDKGQLKRWFENPDKWVGGINNLKAKIMDLKQLLEKELNAITGEMDNKREQATYRDLMTGFGIVLDKLLVIDGQVTSRTENITTNWLEELKKERAKYDPRDETN